MGMGMSSQPGPAPAPQPYMGAGNNQQALIAAMNAQSQQGPQQGQQPPPQMPMPPPMPSPGQGGPPPQQPPPGNGFTPMPGIVYGSRMPNPATQQGGATPQSMGLQNIPQSNFDFNGPKASTPGVNTAPPPQPVQNTPVQQPRPGLSAGAGAGGNPASMGMGPTGPVGGLGIGANGPQAGSPAYNAMINGMQRTAPMAPLPTKTPPAVAPVAPKVSAPVAINTGRLGIGGLGKGSKS